MRARRTEMSGIINSYGTPEGIGYGEGSGKRIDKGPENKTAQWMDFIAKRKEEIVEKVRKGETEPSIPIGAASFTYKQWNKLMGNVDRSIDDIQERVREEEEEEQKIREKEENSITAEMLAALLGIDGEETETAFAWQQDKKEG